MPGPDADAAVLQVLRRADGPLTPREVRTRLEADGLTADDAARVWNRVRRRIRAHEHVIVEGRRYRWVAQPAAISPLKALDLLVGGGMSAARKADCLALLRSALADHGGDREAAARQRQSAIDSVRALADLASDVEELTANEVGPDVMIRKVRWRVDRYGLEPIGRAGVEASFDPRRHRPIGPSIRDGAPVIVVRPGYMWRSPSEEVLLEKAVVEE
jgi:hypothetical protein